MTVGSSGGSGRRSLTRRQEMLIRRLLAGGATQDEAAAAAGITRRRLQERLRDQLSDVRVGRGRGGGPGRFADIDEEEIYARAAALRETWTPERRMEAWNPLWRPADNGGNFTGGGG